MITVTYGRQKRIGVTQGGLGWKRSFLNSEDREGGGGEGSAEHSAGWGRGHSTF